MLTSTVDSIRTVLASHDSLLTSLRTRIDSIAAAVPDTVRDTTWFGLLDSPGHAGSITTRDWIGWVVTLSGIAIAASVAIRGWRKAEQTARNVQEQRRLSEEDRRRAQLVLRVRGALETIVTTARATLKKDAKRPINPETMRGILVDWERYERVADDLDLLGDPGIEESIEAVLGFSRMVAEKIMEDERRFLVTRDKLGQVKPEGLYVHPSVIKGIEDQRAKLHGVLTTMELRAQELVEAFNLRWPPRAGHEERTVPEPTAEDSTPTHPTPTE